MTPPIEESLFDFIDDFANQLKTGKIGRWDTVERSSDMLAFCESFFDQFFGSLGSSITGFGRKSKQNAGELAERLHRDEPDSTRDARRIIVMFEEFCDMYSDLSSNYSSGSDVTYDIFHEDYLTRLLGLAGDWATNTGQESLAARIEQCSRTYEDAVEDTEWLTKTRKKESVWQKLTSRGRTNS
ncbi:hypothetical protein [Paractinoplanes toevensis]|uniref:Uncharacterized protein n=1 Tax=Paractinoplanes toevensis TaxID=571911 RepID=A0A919W0J4_9ACTN|nr:hypothetical protein [Actinoplanes toevensis]GIM89299.1 hypothetical protein Ato02nite_010920 [Actinoplanes toevensis]